MSKFIKNSRYKNHKVSFKDAILSFNEECIAEVADEHADALAELNGYSLIAEDNEENNNEDNSTDNEDVKVPENSTEEDLKTILSNMTIKQLNRYATSENVDLGSATKKDDIVNTIVQAKESR